MHLLSSGRICYSFRRSKRALLYIRHPDMEHEGRHRGGVGASPRRMLKPFTLKHFLDCAIEQCSDAVESWLVSRLMHDGKLVDHLSDATKKLP